MSILPEEKDRLRAEQARSEEFLGWFREIGAIQSGHFVLTSCKHSKVYINKDAIYPHVLQLSRICQNIANYFRYSLAQPTEVVAAPALGGIALSQWTAYHLAEEPLDIAEIPFAIYAEKSDGILEFRRGYDRLIPGRRVLVVDDILTTGGSVIGVIDAVRKLGGSVVGVGVLCNRGGITAEQLDVPLLYSLTSLPTDAWDEPECPLCREGVEINTDVGKGKEYLAKKASAGEKEPKKDLYTEGR